MGPRGRLSAGHRFRSPEDVMRRALELAALRRGFVEPNPMVGAVIVDNQLQLIGEGHHERFGGPHAEIHALQQAGERARGATLYVTLEPCCHTGKTGPCSRAVIEAGVARVVTAMVDPAAHASGGGIAQLREAGIAVDVGMLECEARRLTAPFTKLVTTGMPYVHAKWAMTLDGKIASRTGSSQWISNERSRAIVHELRGRMDAICVGAGTVQSDDPLLTARPPGSRRPARIVVSSKGRLPLGSKLVQSVAEAPVVLIVGEQADMRHLDRLKAACVEILHAPSSEQGQVDLTRALKELGRRQMTNILVEGGGGLLGSLFDQQLIDEVHVFIAPKLVGGADATSPLTGLGLADMATLPRIDEPEIQMLDGDVYVHGPLVR